MRRSERLIRNTVLALFGATVLHVAFNRLYAINNPAHGAQRTPAAELAQLRDFSRIELNGDFSVEIVQDADYSVEFMAQDANRGGFSAVVHDDTLVLRGFGNPPTNQVRVEMPALTHVDSSSVAALTVSGFKGESLSMRLNETPRVILRNNTIRHLRIVSSERSELKADRASLQSSQVDLAGRATLTVID